MRQLLASVLLATLASVGTPSGERPSDEAQSVDASARAHPLWEASPPADPRAVEGYALSTSVFPGEELALAVSTAPAARFRVEIVRVGWAGGAGAKLVGCVPAGCTAAVQGRPQPFPTPDAATGEIRAGWPASLSIPIGEGWRSGYYLARLVLLEGLESGRSAIVPFVVRAPAGRMTPPVLVVAPVNTWQEYNGWGGRNTYSDGVVAHRVSFDRPYEQGLRKLVIDYPLVRFLDRLPLRVGFVTDVDLDRAPEMLLDARLVVFTAHTEYWTRAMRGAVEQAVGHGVNAAFLGGNSMYWQTRYVDASRRALWQYRSAAIDPVDDRRLETVRWRDAPLDRPECLVMGLQWQGADDDTGDGPRDFVTTVAAASHPWFAGTGLRPGDRIRGAVGKEWDAVAPECAGRVSPVVLFHAEGRATPTPPGYYASSFHSTDADMVVTQMRSGARVLSAGSIDLVWTLAGGVTGAALAPGTTDPETPPDVRLQRLLRNALLDLATP